MSIQKLKNFFGVPTLVLGSLLFLVVLSGVLLTPLTAHAADPCAGIKNPTDQAACKRDNTSNGDGGSGTFANPSSVPFKDPGDGSCLSLSHSYSQTGLINQLCNVNDPRPAIQVITEKAANFLLGLGTFVIVIVVIVAGVAITTAGAGGGGVQDLKSGKKHITAALTSLALLWLGRLIFDLTGLTGGHILGVDVSSQPFNWDTFLAVVTSATTYISFVGGFLGVAFLIIGGIKLMTSQGNPQGIASARKTITFALIGLAVIASAALIINVVKLLVTGA